MIKILNLLKAISFKKSESIFKLLAALLLLIIVLVLGLYIANFHDQSISDTSSHWGEFGDYIGGLLNPVFSFFSLIALLITISIQTKQLKLSSDELKLSREELRLTRLELEKSALAQNESQLALNRQVEIANKSSELNTINFLINRYEHELNSLQGYFAQGSVYALRKTELQDKKNTLVARIEETYDDLESNRR